MKILIIRHADPDYSIDSLTETGWKEAQALTKRLEKLDISAFYVSPMGRAQDTASFLLKQKHAEAKIYPWLREFGHRIQKPGEDRLTVPWDWLPEIWTKEKKYYDLNTWSDTEIFHEAQLPEQYSWVTEGFDEILSHHGYIRDGNCYRVEQANEDTIVFFCHFGLECVLLSHLLHISPMLLWHGTCVPPASVTTLVSEERRKGIAHFRMTAFGDTSHLYAENMEPSFSARFCETYERHDQRHD